MSVDGEWEESRQVLHAGRSRQRIGALTSATLFAVFYVTGKSHALYDRVEQLCGRAIKWGELRRKAKVRIQE